MNINAMMAQAKKMQAEVDKSQKELETKEFVVEKQGIKVTMFGNKKIKSVELNEVLVDPEDKEILEDMIIIAVNEALDIVEEEIKKIQPSAPGGMPF